MTEFLDNMDDELTAGYFARLDQHLDGSRLPMKLDEFLELEFRFYSHWRDGGVDCGDSLSFRV